MIEVTSAEEGAALRWLAKRGQRVGRPTPLLTALIATRQPKYNRGWRRYFAIVLGVSIIGSGYPLLFGFEGIQSGNAYFIPFGIQLAFWDGIRRRERKLGASVPSRSPAEPWWRVLGSWYLVAFVATIGGGIALAVAMYFTTEARTYALSWLGLLVLGALSSGWMLTSILRGPAFGEAPEPVAVQRVLRTERIYLAMPGYVVLPIAIDPVLVTVTGTGPPAEFHAVAGPLHRGGGGPPGDQRHPALAPTAEAATRPLRQTAAPGSGHARRQVTTGKPR
jgi:hypothetical protein